MSQGTLSVAIVLIIPSGAFNQGRSGRSEAFSKTSPTHTEGATWHHVKGSADWRPPDSDSVVDVAMAGIARRWIMMYEIDPRSINHVTSQAGSEIVWAALN